MFGKNSNEAEQNAKNPNVKRAGFGVTMATLGSIVLAACSPNPNPEATPPESKPSAEATVSYPEEATEYMAAFGNRYVDPVATYYADADYTETHGISTTVNDFYFEDYVAEGGSTSELSTLGFGINKIDPSVELSEVPISDIFNANLDGMNKLINYLAKNPLPEQQSVLTDEFVDYSGYANTRAANLVQTLQGVVSKHGSASNYEILPAIIDSGAELDPDEYSIFKHNLLIDAVDENGRVLKTNMPMDLTIKVTTFDDKGEKTETIERLENTQFSVQRAPKGNDPLNGGLVGIGVM